MRPALRAALIVAVRLYQRTLSRVLPPTCRFHPSCSAYMIEAVERHGLLRGGVLGLWRIVRCNPFCKGGHDPVPPTGQPLGEDAKPDGCAAQANELKT